LAERKGEVLYSFTQITAKNIRLFLLPGEYQVIYQINMTDTDSNWQDVSSATFSMKKLIELSSPPTIKKGENLNYQYKFLVPAKFTYPFCIALFKKEQLYQMKMLDANTPREGTLTFNTSVHMSGDFQLRFMYKVSNEETVVLETCTCSCKEDIYTENEITIQIEKGVDPTNIKPEQNFILNYECDANSPNKLHQSQEWGGIWAHNAADAYPPTVMTSICGINDKKGIFQLKAPFNPGNYEFRMFHVTSQTTMKRFPFTVVEKVEVETKAVEPKNVEPQAVETKAVEPKEVEPSVVLNVPKPPTYHSWEEFFAACGEAIPSTLHTSYSAIFKAYKVDISKLKNIDCGFLSTINIKTPAHQLAIMEKVNEIKEAEIIAKVVEIVKSMK